MTYHGGLAVTNKMLYFYTAEAASDMTFMFIYTDYLMLLECDVTY